VRIGPAPVTDLVRDPKLQGGVRRQAAALVGQQLRGQHRDDQDASQLIGGINELSQHLERVQDRSLGVVGARAFLQGWPTSLCQSPKIQVDQQPAGTGTPDQPRQRQQQRPRIVSPDPAVDERRAQRRQGGRLTTQPTEDSCVLGWIDITLR
jgi:hypothetical protein